VQPDRAAVDRHDVETYFRFGWEELKIIFRDGADSPALARVDGAERVAVRACRARFDLDEHEGIALACDDIDLAVRRAQVSAFDAKTERYQVVGGGDFPLAPDDVFSQNASAFADGSRSKSVSASRTR